MILYAHILYTMRPVRLWPKLWQTHRLPCLVGLSISAHDGSSFTAFDKHYVSNWHERKAHERMYLFLPPPSSDEWKPLSDIKLLISEMIFNYSRYDEDLRIIMSGDEVEMCMMRSLVQGVDEAVRVSIESVDTYFRAAAKYLPDEAFSETSDFTMIVDKLADRDYTEPHKMEMLASHPLIGYMVLTKYKVRDWPIKIMQRYEQLNLVMKQTLSAMVANDEILPNDEDDSVE